ncbi:MAG: glycosyltransferase [Hyphomicrobiales bacterium]|nr:glycosyltransferase [Hyphomicrobiales bacterium]
MFSPSAPDRVVARIFAPEISFLLSLGVDPRLLARAAEEARRTGVSPEAALIAARGPLDEDTFYRGLADFAGMPFIARAAALPPDLDYGAAQAAGLAPLTGCGGRRWLLAPRGRAIAALLRAGDNSAYALTSPRRFSAMLRAAVAPQLVHDATMRLAQETPQFSARVGLSFAERCAAALTAAALCALAATAPGVAAPLFEIGCALVFGLAVCARLLVAAHAGLERPPAPALREEALPVYTILAPVYREAQLARRLFDALERIDYPRAKLDIKFIVEENDVDTLAAFAALAAGAAEYEVIVAPAGAPQTKPRALEIALPFARGALLTIYDAEDEPHPDQLRLAAARFARADERLACVQARLVIDHAHENAVAGFFALDYAGLFEAINPGLAALGLPIALGGTSNHFRTALLRRAHGWDPYNVTEDADLGLRLARLGYRVETIQSQTGEEAPLTVRAFLRQRTRWTKGWMQTAYVHLRHPRALARDLPPLSLAVVLAAFAAGVLSPLLWPFYTLLTAIDAASGALFHPADWTGVVRSTLACWLALAGPAAFIWPALIGMARQKRLRQWPLLALWPVWCLGLSVAAWLALYELWKAPFHWAKTDHGMARRRRAMAKTAATG